jgi:CRP-like cAMP-binding protein
MSPYSSRWIRRLARFTSLTLEEQRLLTELTSSARPFPSNDGLVKAGDPADRVFVVLDGLACRYKLLSDGRRQILAYLFAGDMGDPRQLLLNCADCSMCVLRPSEIATLTPASMQRLERHPNIVLAISRYTLMQQAIANEWLVNVGHRTAVERVSHLLCETYTRLEAVGLTQDHSFELALTQAELGDTLALSAVHVNRTLMELRRLKLATFQNRRVQIHDYHGLQRAAGFDNQYLRANEETEARASSAM